MRRVLLVVTAFMLVVFLVGYVVADILDRVPGVLTRAEPIPTGLRPMPAAAANPVSGQPSAVALDPGALAATLGPLLQDRALGRDTGVVVRDGQEGQVLWSVGADEPRTLASLQKIIAVPALTNALPLDARMATKAVVGGDPGEVILVAGGDTLLAAADGDRGAVVGHAGLADLAAQVAAHAPAGPVVVHLDTSYAAGPRSVSTWDPADVAGGYTRGVAQIGLADLRPVDGRVPRVETDDDVLQAFAAALRERGRQVTVPERGERLAPATPPVAGATVLGSVNSATYLEVLGYALEQSDNALVENLVRQAMVVRKVPIPEDGQTGQFVTDGIADLQVPVDGVTLSDACGLAPGQRAPLTVVDAVLARGVNNSDPRLRRVIARLPIAGESGTLRDRFTGADSAQVAGIPRAKTGTLTGVSALAGTTVDADGRLLSFVIVANQVPAGPAGTKAARAALDRFAATLTGCGCR